MSQLGRVLERDAMCSVTNAKPKERQARILAGQIDGLDQSRAYQLLNELNWDLRTGYWSHLDGIVEMPETLSQANARSVSC